MDISIDDQIDVIFNRSEKLEEDEYIKFGSMCDFYDRKSYLADWAKELLNKYYIKVCDEG